MLSIFLLNLYKYLQDFLNKETNTKEDQLHVPKLDNITINNLLFADDLKILSWSKYDLQKKIPILENYCEKWRLEFILDQTKVSNDI